jgi:hypothetical protein
VQNHPLPAADGRNEMISNFCSFTVKQKHFENKLFPILQFYSTTKLQSMFVFEKNRFKFFLLPNFKNLS